MNMRRPGRGAALVTAEDLLAAPKCKRITIAVTEDKHTEIKTRATALRMSVTDYVLAALDDFAKAEEGDAKR